ncbi:uncharacterized protein LOC127287187 [Leptopilina boulardi]|uniref:uncharacterized protein LOC127287187 n=1 Tax=Leptopilina boulardi TaxID=63433 RepID=UPI0021F60AAA|nr:uncharacterized protein LOC127287187 [Leptopilina boulardi]
MLNYFMILVIVHHWLNLLNLVRRYLEQIQMAEGRRWYCANNDSEEFYNLVRMDVECFQNLYNILHFRLLKTSLRKPLSGELKLALTLSYMAHGDSLFSTANLFHVGKSTTYKIVGEVCPIIWELLSPIYLAWKSAEELKVVAEGYQRRWNFPHCLGSLDGKEIRIKAPPHSGSMFYCYKKFFSFKLLAMCDAFYRFTWVNVGDYGSISDLSAFRNTHLFQALERNEVDLPEDDFLPRSNIRMPFFFIGDAIFDIKRYFMLPYNRNRRLCREETTFNKSYLS